MTRLDLVVGPNGAGKTTFVRLVLNPEVPFSVFVNADEIAKQQWPDNLEEHSYEAAEIAERTRTALIHARAPFIAETVFSHPAKLDLIRAAKAAAYTVRLHVVIIPEDLAVARVAHRVQAGGHNVPETKIRERHARLFALVADAIALVDTTTVYDNSQISGPKIVARMSQGFTVGASAWPEWTPEALRRRWP